MDPARLTALPGALSTERLAPDLAHTQGDHAQALRLYAWNVEIASAFWACMSLRSLSEMRSTTR
jgi:hypothetical protein